MHSAAKSSTNLTSQSLRTAHGSGRPSWTYRSMNPPVGSIFSRHRSWYHEFWSAPFPLWSSPVALACSTGSPSLVERSAWRPARFFLQVYVLGPLPSAHQSSLCGRSNTSLYWRGILQLETLSSSSRQSCNLSPLIRVWLLSGRVRSSGSPSERKSHPGPHYLQSRRGHAIHESTFRRWPSILALYDHLAISLPPAIL